jgi:hypothetical protein
MTGWLLLNFSTAALVVLVIVVPTALAMLGVWLVRRRYGWQEMAANIEEGGVLFSIVGTIYAIFLAFLVVVAWQELGDAEKIVAEEGATLVSIYRDVAVFQPAIRDRLRAELRGYTQAVIEHEWPRMAHGEESPVAARGLEDLWQTYLSIEPTTPREIAAFKEAFARMNELGKQRKLRILASQASIPEVFWALLIFGAAATIGFTFFLGMRHQRVQLVMTGILTIMITSALFLVVVLDNPFTGDIRAEPEPFIQALRDMK